ncbi:hypothetical protein [Flavobacterium aquicola]|uniref:Uncharacterized protein n=1 Tax=Flavobacterium aquicola TaxID=1682742 RepID=A0A3E0EMU6_9FLAO|nr:hypothetical protein [Flavobacterium aquicola]REG99033.1 hypothetical protein C8P67_105199 [Flavobacterium aquicola]
MKESNKNIEDLIEKMMAEDTLESPSIDFTKKIMSQVLIAEEHRTKIYKPLISNTTWFFIAFMLLIVGVYAFLFSGTENNLEIGKIYSERAAAFFSGIHFSRNIMYAILIVPFMILIQIGLLKNYFDKKYQF